MDTTASLVPTAGHWPIRGGMTVYGADGDLVGTVTEVGPTDLTVERRCVVTTVSDTAASASVWPRWAALSSTSNAGAVWRSGVLTPRARPRPPAS